MSTFSSIRVLNELDHLRLRRLLPTRGGPGPLAELLDAADLLPPQEMPPDVATMRSSLLLEDLASGTQQLYTLSYPEDADPARGGSVGVVASRCLPSGFESGRGVFLAGS